MPLGLLGCRFEMDGDHVEFAELWQGDDWDTETRNPLIAAGVQLGDRLLAVEGETVSIQKNPYGYFARRTSRAVQLKVQTAGEDGHFNRGRIADRLRQEWRSLFAAGTATATD